MQASIHCHPVYTFVKDTKKGQTNGEGPNPFGGTRDALLPAGAKVARHAANGGTGGY